jgi:hypothetical protein
MRNERKCPEELLLLQIQENPPKMVAAPLKAVEAMAEKKTPLQKVVAVMMRLVVAEVVKTKVAVEVAVMMKAVEEAEEMMKVEVEAEEKINNSSNLFYDKLTFNKS